MLSIQHVRCSLCCKRNPSITLFPVAASATIPSMLLPRGVILGKKKEKQKTIKGETITPYRVIQTRGSFSSRDDRVIKIIERKRTNDVTICLRQRERESSTESRVYQHSSKTVKTIPRVFT